MSAKLKQTREKFIEHIGLVAQADGLPRIAGRLMALLVFDGKAYSFSELATELQVSRGSVSTNARLLESLGVIERLAKPGDRQDYFVLGENPYQTLLQRAATRARKAEKDISKVADTLPGKEKNIAKRVRDLGQFYNAVTNAIEDANNSLSSK